MIKVINCKKKNYKRELTSFLEKRRSGKAVDTSIVPKIIIEFLSFIHYKNQKILSI